MARQLISDGDNSRLINAKVMANLAELSLLPRNHAARPDFIRSPRAAATILDQQLAGIGGPKFTGAARNFRSFARDANERFASAYAVLGPFMEAGFERGVYSIGGVSKTLSEIIPDLGALTVVAGEGLEAHNATASVSQSAFFSAEVFAALGPTHECSGVFDVTVSHSTCQADIWVGDNPADGCGTLNGNAFLIDFGGTGEHVVGPLSPVGTVSRVAFTLSQAALVCSVNGGAPVSVVPSNNFAAWGDVYPFLFANAGERTTVPKITLCAPVADHGLLQRMSASSGL